jgi:hypothetical protein
MPKLIHAMSLRFVILPWTIRCLLSLWLFFGCLELAETVQLIPEAGVEDQAGLDPDEDALAALESGLKSDVLLAGDNHSSVITTIVEPTLSVSFSGFEPFTHQSLPPPPVPLYQQFSVYRI